MPAVHRRDIQPRHRGVTVACFHMRSGGGAAGYVDTVRAATEAYDAKKW